MLTAQILVTGDEIRTGTRQDSHCSWIAEKLEENNVRVRRHICVGDDLEEISRTLQEMSSRSEVGIVTGGLGPTSDDVTAEAAAKAAGTELELNEKALQDIEKFFQKMGRELTRINQKPAMIPKGAEVIANPSGTAPGFKLRIGQCVFFFLPGVPGEMHRMFPKGVLEQIYSIFGSGGELLTSKTLSTFGLFESTISEKLQGMEQQFPGLKLGFRAKFPEIQIRLYARGNNAGTLNQQIQSAVELIRSRLGHVVFSEQEQSMAEVVGEELRKEQRSLAVAESCTGGLIANLITSVSGCSDYFLFSAVAYANSVKSRVLKVREQTLRDHGAVHQETAKEMALGAQQVGGADYALSTTGIAGPTGGTKQKPVGTVYIGLATPQEVRARHFHFNFSSRSLNKKIFAVTALDMLRKELLLNSKKD